MFEQWGWAAAVCPRAQLMSLSHSPPLSIYLSIPKKSQLYPSTNDLDGYLESPTTLQILMTHCKLKPMKIDTLIGGEGGFSECYCQEGIYHNIS